MPPGAQVRAWAPVAEYVEHDETRELIRKLGVDFAQGHAIGKPQPLEDVLASLENLEASTG